MEAGGPASFSATGSDIVYLADLEERGGDGEGRKGPLEGGGERALSGSSGEQL